MKCFFNCVVGNDVFIIFGMGNIQNCVLHSFVNNFLGNIASLFKAVLKCVERRRQKDIGPAFRVALIGETSSIGIFEIIAVIGFEETKKRILCNF